MSKDTHRAIREYLTLPNSTYIENKNNHTDQKNFSFNLFSLKKFSIKKDKS